nr:CidA/LrgA family protein [uncultured Bacillus sp.]
MRKFLIILLQLMILMAVNQLGGLIVKWTHIPIPGNVIGMILLFFLLCSGLLRLQWIEGASAILTKHLAFFFIPISVGIMTLGSLLSNSGFTILFILFISTFIGIFFSGSLSQLLILKKEGLKAESHRHSL